MHQFNIIRPNARLYEQMVRHPAEIDFPSDLMSAERFAELNAAGDIQALDLPDPVRACTSILRANGIWHAITQGETAMSCPDAAGKRWNRGVIGIPLMSELKTLVGKHGPKSGEPNYVAVHVSAADRVDMKSLKGYLGAKTSPVEEDELAERLGAQFGTVNPVQLSLHDNVLQLWDLAVATRYKTMHTNAGHHNYGLEFLPIELFNELPHRKDTHPLTERSQGMDLIVE